MTSLRHPNVARVYDFEQVAAVDAFFFTMELLPGVPLDRFVAGRIVPWEETLDLLVPVIRALAYLHGRGVVHFDLKPGNIVVSSRGALRHVKVLDFGLAGLRGIRGLVMGTPDYLSPEIALTGETPYGASQGLDVLLKRKMTEPVRFAARALGGVPAHNFPARDGADEARDRSPGDVVRPQRGEGSLPRHLHGSVPVLRWERWA